MRLICALTVPEDIFEPRGILPYLKSLSLLCLYLLHHYQIPARLDMTYNPLQAAVALGGIMVVGYLCSSRPCWYQFKLGFHALKHLP
jgi:hypothetical protein